MKKNRNSWWMASRPVLFKHRRQATMQTKKLKRFRSIKPHPVLSLWSMMSTAWIRKKDSASSSQLTIRYLICLLKHRQRWWRELWDQRVSSVIMTKTKKIWMSKVSKLLTTLSKEGIKVVDKWWNFLKLRFAMKSHKVWKVVLDVYCLLFLLGSSYTNLSVIFVERAVFECLVDSD